MPRVQKKPQNAKISKVSGFIPKYPLKHHYLLEISYIKMIPTISFIYLYKNWILKTILKYSTNKIYF